VVHQLMLVHDKRYFVLEENNRCNLMVWTMMLFGGQNNPECSCMLERSEALYPDWAEDVGKPESQNSTVDNQHELNPICSLDIIME
jgi:hypothetical protein